MRNCECLEKCPFFNDRMADMPATTQLLKEKYCLRAYTECARFKVFQVLGSELVPPDLFPGQFDRVKAILER